MKDVPAVALKVALTLLEGIDTLAGTVMLPVDVNATVAAVAGGLLKVTVQTATAPGANDDGVHEVPVRIEVETVLAVPPVPVTVRAAPSSVAPIALETPTAAEVTVGVNVTATVATMPLAIRLVLIPVARQI